jgi:S-DNA-T family DNA segregation ATPase FtsK/SpoIIIE
MPSFIPLENIETVPKLSFLVGKTRAREIIPNLLDVPHLLVGGQSGGGKSAFLRQIITTLYLRNEDLKFSLVDLKGGLEFQLFERLKRIKVIGGTDDAASFLESIDGTLEYRMKLLKKHSCVDMEAYVHLLNEKKAKGVFLEEDSEDLTREIIVVDEAAEMFLASSKSSATAVQTARKVLSQVARQGRAVGVHLIVATQRPDAKALDPQIKANLPGVICYRMTNDPSSISVLGNGRATDLPPVKGRAIWKNGSELVEIQTPFLSPEDADAILEPFRITVEGKKYSKRKSKTQKDENGDTPPNSESDDV